MLGFVGLTKVVSQWPVVVWLVVFCRVVVVCWVVVYVVCLLVVVCVLVCLVYTEWMLCLLLLVGSGVVLVTCPGKPFPFCLFSSFCPSFGLFVFDQSFWWEGLLALSVVCNGLLTDLLVVCLLFSLFSLWVGLLLV